MLKILLKPIYFFKKKIAWRYKKKIKNTIIQKKFEPLPNTSKKSPLFIVTLTSYGKRTEDTAPYAIWSLFEQSIKPDKIVLWLDEDNWNLNNIPQLLKTEMEMGLEIKLCKDIKSYKKLNFALQQFPDDILLTVDDDAYYPKDWFAKLLETHRENPDKICCHRAHVIKKGLPYNKWKWKATIKDNAELLFPTGIGGVLYPPHSLDISCLNEIMQLAPQADDIAYWAMAKLKGTKHILAKNGYFEFSLVNGTDEADSLMATNREQGKNDLQFNAVEGFMYTKNSIDVSVIIVSYNTKVLLKQCLESVFAKTQGMEFEVIVVDNASSDGSQQMIKDFFSKVILVETQENLGFGRANNLGFEYAKGRNIFLLNPDTVLLNNAVKILSDYLDNNPQTGVCGGNLYDENCEPVHSFYRCFPSVLLELSALFGDIPFKIRYGKNLEFNHTNKPLKVAYISGADMMLRASVLNVADGFDSDFFMYYEETELTYRIKKLGFFVYSVPNARIIHLESKSFSDNHEKMKLIFNSRNLYYKKTHGWFGRKIVGIMYFFTIHFRIFWLRISGNGRRLNYWKTVRFLSK